MDTGATYQRFPKVKIRELKDDYAKFEIRLGIMIMKLRRGQETEAKGHSKERDRERSRKMVSCSYCYVYSPDRLVSTLSKNCILYKFIAFETSVVVVDPEAYTYDEEVIKKAEAMGKEGLIEIRPKDDSFIFTVESTGAVKASQLVLNAIDLLKQKLDAVRLSDDTVGADDQFGDLGAHMRGG
ncbi:hypothetical protein Bca4012_061467 [Brassica carinata]